MNSFFYCHKILGESVSHIKCLEIKETVILLRNHFRNFCICHVLSFSFLFCIFLKYSTPRPYCTCKHIHSTDLFWDKDPFYIFKLRRGPLFKKEYIKSTDLFWDSGPYSILKLRSLEGGLYSKENTAIAMVPFLVENTT